MYIYKSIMYIYNHVHCICTHAGGVFEYNNNTVDHVTFESGEGFQYGGKIMMFYMYCIQCVHIYLISVRAGTIIASAGVKVNDQCTCTLTRGRAWGRGYA